VKALVDSRGFQGFIIGVIIVNAIILGVETFQGLDPTVASVLAIVNNVAVGIFVVEIALRIFAHGRAFFKDPWGWFDLIIVAIALVPAVNGAAVLRVLRVLRILRLLSTIRSMRMVVGALAASLPGILSIGGLLGIVLYIYTVMATTLFHATSPQFFGDLGISAASLFRIMNGDGWEDIVYPIATNPWIWIFFVTFTIATTFIVLNLFIAVTVEAMDRQREPLERAVEADLRADKAILAELGELKEQIARLETLIAKR
jgi:voltage-gated sodium channel